MTAIRALVADRVRIPLRRPIATASGMWLEHESWVIRVHRDDGRIGLGEAVVEPIGRRGRRHDPDVAHPGGRRRGVREPASVDGGARAARRAGPGAQRGDRERAPRPRAGPGRRCPAGRCRRRGQRDPALARGGCCSGGRPAVDRVGLRDDQGHGRRGTRDRGAGRAIRAIRAAVGSDVRLRLEVNGAWDLSTAEDRLSAISRFDIEFVEQPLPAHDVDGLAELRRRVRVPIAADEAASSVGAVRTLLAAEAVDVLVLKPARVGGPAAVTEIAERAAEHGIPVVIGTLFETGIGLAAASPCRPPAGCGRRLVGDPTRPRPRDRGTARPRPAG